MTIEVNDNDDVATERIKLAAVHEAGHALMWWLLFRRAGWAAITADGTGEARPPAWVKGEATNELGIPLFVANMHPCERALLDVAGVAAESVFTDWNDLPGFDLDPQHEDDDGSHVRQRIKEARPDWDDALVESAVERFYWRALRMLKPWDSEIRHLASILVADQFLPGDMTEVYLASAARAKSYRRLY